MLLKNNRCCFCCLILLIFCCIKIWVSFVAHFLVWIKATINRKQQKQQMLLFSNITPKCSRVGVGTDLVTFEIDEAPKRSKFSPISSIVATSPLQTSLDRFQVVGFWNMIHYCMCQGQNFTAHFESKLCDTPARIQNASLLVSFLMKISISNFRAQQCEPGMR